jgi:hypothetical protein
MQPWLVQGYALFFVIGGSIATYRLLRPDSRKREIPEIMRRTPRLQRAATAGMLLFSVGITALGIGLLSKVPALLWIGGITGASGAVGMGSVGIASGYYRQRFGSGKDHEGKRRPPGYHT